MVLHGKWSSSQWAFVFLSFIIVRCCFFRESEFAILCKISFFFFWPSSRKEAVCYKSCKVWKMIYVAHIYVPFDVSQSCVLVSDLKILKKLKRWNYWYDMNLFFFSRHFLLPENGYKTSTFSWVSKLNVG